MDFVTQENDLLQELADFAFTHKLTSLARLQKELKIKLKP
jgi:hypothetical protein